MSPAADVLVAEHGQGLQLSAHDHDVRNLHFARGHSEVCDVRCSQAAANVPGGTAATVHAGARKEY